MSDNMINPKNLEEAWDIMVASIKKSKLEAHDDQYFEGILEGQLFSLNVIAILLGRQVEYINLCTELDTPTWPYGSKEYD